MEQSGYVTGPRWVDIENPIRRAAIEDGLECTTERAASFLRQTVYFTLKGDANRVERLRRVIEEAAT